MLSPKAVITGDVMQNNPLVSIIVPIYNMGSQLKTAIKYILGQTYKNLEIVLVDDGSDDNTYDVCLELSREDKRIKCVRQQNMGSGPARNNGIKNANGKYVYFPDADDEMSENLIECAVSKLEKYNCDLAVFGFRFVYENAPDKVVRRLDDVVMTGECVREKYQDHIPTREEVGIQGAPWNKVFRLDYIKKNNIEYPSLRRHQDDVFIMRYVDIMERVIFIDEILYTYHANDKKKTFSKFPKDYFDIVSKLTAYRIEYIYGWNKENREALSTICRYFVDGTCTALMFTFNPNHGYTFKERYNAMKKISERFLSELPDPNYRSDSTMFKLMKSKKYLMLYFAAYAALKRYYK